MWDDMYQMSPATNILGVERHSSLPEMSKSEFKEWRDKKRPPYGRSRSVSFSSTSNNENKSGKMKKSSRRRQPGTKLIDPGYITQTFLNNRITWDEDMDISAKSTSRISLKNSIQAILDANDSLVTDSYKTLNDAEVWSKSNDSLSSIDAKEALITNDSDTNTIPSTTKSDTEDDSERAELNDSEDTGRAVLKEATFPNRKTEEGKSQYSYTIDAELSYQEYNKLMHIIVNTLKEKRKWEEFIKEAEEKLESTTMERMELMENNRVLRESLETANSAIKDISCKVQKLKESLGPLRDENNYLKQENKELKESIEKSRKICESTMHDVTGSLCDVTKDTKGCCDEKCFKESEIEEYKKNMHDKFRKLEEAYENYRNEMEGKHSDMSRTIDEVNVLYDTSKCNVEELKCENEILNKESESLKAKNEKLTKEIQEMLEADKIMRSESSENQIRYENSQKAEEEYKKQMKSTQDEIEKHKWEVYFYKEESQSLEKDNKALKTNIETLEDRIKSFERKVKMVEEEREREFLENQSLRDEMRELKKQLIEHQEQRCKNDEADKDLETYRKQETTLHLLRIEFEAMKRENLTQKSENERLKTDVEKLKDEAELAGKRYQETTEPNRLMSEMENLRNQLKTLEGKHGSHGSQNKQTKMVTPHNDDIKIELENMKKEMSRFLEAMQEKNDERETQSIKEEIGELKRQLNELDNNLNRSKSNSMNGIHSLKYDSPVESYEGNRGTSTVECYEEDLNDVKAVKEEQKERKSKIQLVIDDDVVKWIDVPIEDSDSVETNFVKVNGHIAIDKSKKPQQVNQKLKELNQQLSQETNHKVDVSTCTNSDDSSLPVSMSDLTRSKSKLKRTSKYVSMTSPTYTRPQSSCNNASSNYSRAPKVNSNTCGIPVSNSNYSGSNSRPNSKYTAKPNSKFSPKSNSKFSQKPNSKISSKPNSKSSPTPNRSNVSSIRSITIRSKKTSQNNDISNDTINDINGDVIPVDVTDSAIYANFEKSGDEKENAELSFHQIYYSPPSEEEDISLRSDRSEKRISFQDECEFNSSNQSWRSDDNHYAISNNNNNNNNNNNDNNNKSKNKQMAPIVELGTNKRHSSLPRDKSTGGGPQKKGLSRSNTYLTSDYKHLTTKYRKDDEKEKKANTAIESRQTQSIIKLNANATERGSCSPKKQQQLSQSQGSIYRQSRNSYNSNNNIVARTPHNNEKSSMSYRCMSRKKPNELFKTQRPTDATKDTNNRQQERKSKPIQQSSIPQAAKKTYPVVRAESMKVKGEEPSLYASIRKKTSLESKESFRRRMDESDNLERLQLERMEAARQKAVLKASQEDITSSPDLTFKRKLAKKKPSPNQTKSITVHGIPVLRTQKNKGEEYEDNKEFTFKNNNRQKSSSTTSLDKQKPKPASKLKRVASLPKAAGLAGDFKHLKNGIKQQLSKTKVYSQSSFEFLTEESMKKYKFVRDTLNTKRKSLCAKADKRGKVGDALVINGENSNGTNQNGGNRNGGSYNGVHQNGVGQNGARQSSDHQNITNQNGVRQNITFQNGGRPHGGQISVSDTNLLHNTNNSYNAHQVEAIYENAKEYTPTKPSCVPNSYKKASSGNKKFSYSDADITCSSQDGDVALNSWQRYYAAGETTPRHSLLSLV